MQKLSDRQLQHYKSIFKVIDTDTDGVISKDQFLRMSRKLGQEISDRQFRLAAQLACDGGELNFENFCSLLRLSQAKNEYEMLFFAADVDQNGLVSESELQVLLQRLRLEVDQRMFSEFAFDVQGFDEVLQLDYPAFVKFVD